MRPNRLTEASRAAATVLELLIAVAVVGVLAAVLLPAVQASREAARATSCRNRLKALGLATAQYAEAFSAYPPGLLPTAGSSTAWDWRGFSAQVRVLPWLERDDLYRGFDLERWAHDGAANDRWAAQPIVALRCPSERPVVVGEDGSGNDPGCNYAYCLGTSLGFEHDGVEIPAADQTGMIAMTRTTRPSDVTDGLTQTILASEQLIAGFEPGIGDRLAVRAMYRYAAATLPLDFPASRATPNQVDQWASICDRVSGRGRHVGRQYHRGLPGQTLFNTLLGPNSRSSNCSNHCVALCEPDGAGLFAARSRHPGLVHSVFGDGAVRPVSDGIDRTVWQRLGDRNDGQPVDFGR